MSVIKVKIQKDFTVVYNRVLENPNLSFKAKGLWAYCMSLPENWQFHVTHLAKVCKDGKNAIYSALKELQKEGLVERCQKREKGIYGPVDYIVYPYPKEIQKILPLTENRDAVKNTSNSRQSKTQVVDNISQSGFPLAVNPPLVRTDKKQERNNKKENMYMKHVHAKERARDRVGDRAMYSKEEQKNCPELKNQGSLQERVDLLKAVKFPGGLTIKQRNVEHWSRLYSLWRLKKGIARVRRMLEAGKELTNPEGLLYKVFKDPECESDKETEDARQAALNWLQSNNEDFVVHDTYVIDYATQRDVMLSYGPSRVTEELTRWSNARRC